MDRRRWTAGAAVVVMFAAWPSLSAGSAGQERAAADSIAQADAQAVQPSGPAVTTGFDTHGSLEIGYRFTSVKGSLPVFRQSFDLAQGMRLTGFDLQGQARDGRSAFADTFAVSASGLGGDPFPTIQVTARKTHLYDLRMNWRKSRFFGLPPSTPTSIAGLSTQAVTDSHTWATNRQIANFAFTLHATQQLHFLFTYDRMENSGVVLSTRAIDFLAAPATWAAFARANPFPVSGPVSDRANRVAGGVSYGGNAWSAHYKAGYQIDDENRTLDLVASPERSINVADPITADESLAVLGWSQHRHLTAPSSEFSYVARPSASVELRGEHLYFRYQGPFSLDASFQGAARTNAGTAFSPYAVAVSTRGQVAEPNHTLGQAFTYRPSDRWALDLTYRYTRFTTEATGSFASLLALYPVLSATAASATDQVEVAWRESLHTIDIRTTYMPMPALTIQPGIRLTARDVESVVDGTIEPATTQRLKIAGPELSVRYQPSAMLSIRGTYKSSYRDASYTRLSPVQRTSGHAVLRFEPLTNLVLEASIDRTNAELPAAAFVSRTHSWGTRVSYGPDDRFSLFGGYDRQSFLGTGNVTFLRGTAPIVRVPMIDDETDRIWQAGATFTSGGLGLSLAANFDRTTGLDTIAGEPPLYGPTTFPYGSGTAYYEIARVGRVSLDVQRTYLHQELLPLNNFRATLLMVRYSRKF